MMDRDVLVLLLGAAPAAYALAASFWEEFSVPVTVMDEELDPVFSVSTYVAQVRRVPGIAHPALLRRALSDFYEAHAGKSLVLLPMTARFSEAVLADREFLDRMYLLPQKFPLKTEEPVAFPDALLLAYRGREGVLRTVYARAVAYGENGAPLALVTKNTPAHLVATLPETDSGFLLYAVKDGALSSYTDGGKLSPLCVFPAASDASLAEWILFDYVLCEEPALVKEDAVALFSLFPYRRIKPRLLPTERKAVKALYKKRLTVTLCALKNERKSLFSRRSIRTFYRKLWEKAAKTKK